MQQSVCLSQLLDGIVEMSVPELAIVAVTSDSRDVRPGALFIALAGFGGEHGLAFAQQAVQAGAVAVLWEPADNAPELPALDCAFVFAVPGLQQRLGLIAARFYGSPSQSLAIVGITGTDGKTSCAWLLLQAWSCLATSAAMVGTLGKGSLGALQRGAFTTPFPIELQASLADFKARNVSHVAMEVSSHALDQARVAETEFDVAVLTNLSRDHLDYHGTEAAYADAKRRLFTDYQPRAWVVNADDAFGRELIATAPESVELFSYGTQTATLQASNLRYDGGLTFDLHYQDQDYLVKTPLLGDFNLDNALAVAAVLLAQGVEIGAVISALAQIKAPPGRLELLQNESLQVVVDYAHTPGALASALTSLRSVTRGRLLCVFGCGGDRDRGKRALMAKAAEQYADGIWVTDDNPRTELPSQIFDDVRAGFNAAGLVNFVHDRAQAISAAVASLEDGDLLLVAGKGHEDYQLIGSQRRHFSDREQVAELLGLAAPEVLYE
jgi:UDP-N-acetylmuramoyl-L-alanyl-D-glutamate--2,6-diaminopimelate ligase